jgi:hypothetical protein
MLNYTLPIPHNEKINKTNSNVVGVFDYKSIALPTELQGHLEKAYIYSRIESQDSFRLFFYAYFLARIIVIYTKTIPQLAIPFLYHSLLARKNKGNLPIDYACNIVSGIV